MSSVEWMIHIHLAGHSVHTKAQWPAPAAHPLWRVCVCEREHHRVTTQTHRGAARVWNCLRRLSSCGLSSMSTIREGEDKTCSRHDDLTPELIQPLRSNRYSCCFPVTHRRKALNYSRNAGVEGEERKCACRGLTTQEFDSSVNTMSIIVTITTTKAVLLLSHPTLY